MKIRNIIPKSASIPAPYLTQNGTGLISQPAIKLLDDYPLCDFSYETLKPLFNQLSKPGDKPFIVRAYAELLRYFGIEKIGPDLFHSNKNIEDGANAAVMGFDGIYKGDLLYTPIVKQDTKINTLGILGHELDHFMGYSFIVRHEKSFNELVKCISKMEIEGRIPAVTKENQETMIPIIREAYSLNKNIAIERLHKIYERVFKFTTPIRDNTPLALKAEKYLAGVKTYNEDSRTRTGYMNNFLEVEAEKLRYKIISGFHRYIQESS